MGRAEGEGVPPSAATIGVELVYAAAAHEVDLCTLRLEAGATVAQALRASGLLARHGLQADRVDLGVWGEPCAQDRVLRDGDRVELYRPLGVDPKEARRQRARPSGGRSRRA